MDILSKRQQDITAADIYALCKHSAREREFLEFKREAPDKAAREQILKEVVAFANSFGGALVLGIAEGEAGDAAERLCPLEDCAATAQSFIETFSHKVDPLLPSCEIFHVDLAPETADEAGITWKEGAGFVVFRIPERSRLAPHAIKFTSQRFSSPRRYGSTSRVMSMREIQDLTLNTERGMRQLERQLEARHERFIQNFHHFPGFSVAPARLNAHGFRITAAPVHPRPTHTRVFASPTSLAAGLQRLAVTLEASTPDVQLVTHNGPRGLKAAHGPIDGVLLRGTSPSRLGAPPDSPWAPILHGARTTSYPPEVKSGVPVPMALELHNDGLVELIYGHQAPPPPQSGARRVIRMISC